MYSCIHVYVLHMCIYMHTYTYVCIYDKRALSSSMLTSAWCGGEAPLAVICLFTFVQYVRWTTKTSGLARTACARAYSVECMSARRSSFQCTVMYWLLAMAYAARFREGNALPAIHLHPVWIRLTAPSTQLAYICTRGHMHFPVFIFQSNRQMPLSFNRSLRERVRGTGLGGKCVTVRSL